MRDHTLVPRTGDKSLSSFIAPLSSDDLFHWWETILLYYTKDWRCRITPLEGGALIRLAGIKAADSAESQMRRMRKSDESSADDGVSFSQC